MNAVHGGLAGLVPRVGQVLLQGLELILQTLVALGQGQTVVETLHEG